MKIFYHRADYDGIGSAAVINNFLHNEEFEENKLFNNVKNVEFIGADYPDDSEKYYSEITDGDRVLFIDYILQPFNLMLDLSKRCEVIVIDHHLTTINNFKNENNYLFYEVILGDEGNSKAACQLIWEYLYPGSHIPLTLLWLSKYDVWKHEDDEEILNFQLGIRNKRPDFNSKMWNELLVHSKSEENLDLLNEIIDEGEIISTYEVNSNDFLINEGAFNFKLNNYNIIAVNTDKRGSKIFDSIFNPEIHDICMPFVLLKNGKWRYSLYSSKSDIDCSSIAKLYGGGGHRGAAGFQTNKLLEEINGQTS